MQPLIHNTMQHLTTHTIIITHVVDHTTPCCGTTTTLTQTQPQPNVYSTHPGA
jgi:hypothetical protein